MYICEFVSQMPLGGLEIAPPSPHTLSAHPGPLQMENAWLV